MGVGPQKRVAAVMLLMGAVVLSTFALRDHAGQPRWAREPRPCLGLDLTKYANQPLVASVHASAMVSRDLCMPLGRPLRTTAMSDAGSWSLDRSTDPSHIAFHPQAATARPLSVVLSDGDALYNVMVHPE